MLRRDMENTRKRLLAVIAVLAFGWLVILTVRTSLYALLVEIGSEFSLSGTQLGTITSAYFLVYVAMQIPGGMLGDRFGLKRILAIPSSLLVGRLADSAGRRRVCLGLLPLAAVAITATSYAGAVPAVLGALAVYGIVGKLSWDSVAAAWLGDHSTRSNPESVATTMGFANFVGNLSQVVSPFVCGMIRDATGTLQPAFLLAAGVVLVAVVCCWAVPERAAALVAAGGASRSVRD